MRADASKEAGKKAGAIMASAELSRKEKEKGKNSAERKVCCGHGRHGYTKNAEEGINSEETSIHLPWRCLLLHEGRD